MLSLKVTEMYFMPMHFIYQMPTTHLTWKDSSDNPDFTEQFYYYTPLLPTGQVISQLLTID